MQSHVETVYTNPKLRASVRRTDFTQDDPNRQTAPQFVVTIKTGNYLWEYEARALVELLQEALRD